MDLCISLMRERFIHLLRIFLRARRVFLYGQSDCLPQAAKSLKPAPKNLAGRVTKGGLNRVIDNDFAVGLSFGSFAGGLCVQVEISASY
jgi:hypothetical protein